MSTTHDPGGKVRTAVRAGIQADAIFGGDYDEYRYSLSRTWDATKKRVLVIMMNPSTADAMVDDPTIAKVIRLARRWHGGAFGELLVGNAFAYRATDQADLLNAPDPVGPQNDEYLLAMAARANLIVMAYGTPKIKALRRRGPQVAENLLTGGRGPLHALRLSKADIPWHPLYLPENIEPFVWRT